MGSTTLLHPDLNNIEQVVIRLHQPDQFLGVYNVLITRLKIDQVDAILFAEQPMINIVIMAEQHC